MWDSTRVLLACGTGGCHSLCSWWKLWGLLLEAPESPMAWPLGRTRPPLTASPGPDPTPSPPLRPHFPASSECLEGPDHVQAGDSLPSPLEHRGSCLSAFWGCRVPGPCAGPTTPYTGFHQHRCTWDLPSGSGGSLSGPPGPPSPSRLSVCLDWGLRPSGLHRAEIVLSPPEGWCYVRVQTST